jgi:predicted nucleic acid-binding protein
MSGIVLDTDVMIDLLREHKAAEAWLRSLEAFPAVSCFTVLELLAGSQDKSEYRRVEQMLMDFSVLYPAMEDLEAAAFRLTPFALSHGVGCLDLLIASVALGHGLTLATFNLKHFRVIPGLQTI